MTWQPKYVGPYTVVANGQAAVVAARNASPPFDCILMDCKMPVLGGAVHVESIKILLKSAYGVFNQRFELSYHKLLSTLAINF
jgi:hypothetical protein